jgi:hypothetical protein
MEVWFCAVTGTYAARHNAPTGPATLHKAVAEKEEQTSSKHRRLRLRYAQQGFAPAPAARLIAAIKETRRTLTGCMGDLRLPP